MMLRTHFEPRYFDGSASPPFGGVTAKFAFKWRASVPPPNLLTPQQMGRVWSSEGFTSEVVTVKPLINTEFTTSLATQLPVESDQPWMSKPTERTL